MKVESPLFRKVEFSFSQFCSPVIMWLTDSEIDDFGNRDLSKFDLYRLRPSPYTLIEFKIDCLSGWVKTNEIRHKESPVVFQTSISGFDRLFGEDNSTRDNPLRQTISAVVYFKNNEGSQSFALTESPELENLLNSSLTFFDNIFDKKIPSDGFIETKNIILIEYLLTDNR